MTLRRATAWAVICIAAVVAGAPARAAEVDLALVVLAVDISSSVNQERYRLQMNGYAEAFRDPSVIEAFQPGQVEPSLSPLSSGRAIANIGRRLIGPSCMTQGLQSALPVRLPKPREHRAALPRSAVPSMFQRSFSAKVAIRRRTG